MSTLSYDGVKTAVPVNLNNARIALNTGPIIQGVFNQVFVPLAGALNLDDYEYFFVTAAMAIDLGPLAFPYTFTTTLNVRLNGVLQTNFVCLHTYSLQTGVILGTPTIGGELIAISGIAGNLATIQVDGTWAMNFAGNGELSAIFNFYRKSA